MDSIKSARWVFGAASTVLLWGLAQGCGPSVATFCDKVCDCGGCTETERTDCVDDIQDSAKSAGDAGCSGEWDSYFSCANAELECTNDAPSVDGCDSEMEALVDCAGPLPGIGGSCSSICEESKSCDGADPSVDCAESCSDSEAIADGTGCRALFDSIVSCASNAPDVCNSTGSLCNDEGSKYLDCVVTFCTDNPDTDVCKG